MKVGPPEKEQTAGTSQVFERVVLTPCSGSVKSKVFKLFKPF